MFKYFKDLSNFTDEKLREMYDEFDDNEPEKQQEIAIELGKRNRNKHDDSYKHELPRVNQ